MSGLARPELLASADWLADALGRPELRVLDVRWRPDGTGAEVHGRGHVPGAAYLDWHAGLVESEEGPATLLAGPDRVAAALAEAGVGDGTTLVVYDDTASLYAARVWWTLRAYGYESCRILDGGYGAWTADPSRPVASGSVRPEPARFSPRSDLRARLTTADVRDALGSPDVLLVDARPPAEYRGFEGNGRRLGHVPGAINIPVAATTRPTDQRFRDGEELRALVRGANVTRSRRIVCYDGSGVAAAKLAFVLTLLGHDDVAVYDGGWAEWGDRLDLPVER